MKTILYSIVLLVVGLQLHAQTSLSDKNYIHTIIPQGPITIDAIENVNCSTIGQSSHTIESVTYFDGLGRPMQQRAIKASGAGAPIVNLLPEDWSEGQGSTPFYNQNGSTAENNRVMGIDPAGERSLLWRCGSDADSNADGGWNTAYFEIDNTASYRYTVWVKRTGSQDGSTYHGIQNVNNLNGSENGNPYFWHGDLPKLDTWYLLVGVVHPHQYTGGNSGISGVYDSYGNKVITGTDFKWRSTMTSTRFRSYLYYSTDLNTKQFFWNPVVQKLNGNERSIIAIALGAQQEIGDIVTHITYDDYGRQDKQYLPFVSGDNGAFKTVNVIDDINSYYLNKHREDFPGITNPSEVNAYSESVFEQSPLNRVLEQGAPGAAWKANPGSDTDHTIKFDWATNTTGEVIRFDVDFPKPNNTEAPALQQNGHYLANELYVTITKDENWKPGDEDLRTTKEYKDKLGRVILKRTYNNSSSPSTGGGGEAGGGAHDTYYVYDDFGNLTYVIPPKVDTSDGVSNIELDQLCYQYRYDYRNRLIEKKIPGKGDQNNWESIVYNKLDQPVLTQDPNQKAKNEWLFTKYDAFGRVAYTGKITIPNKTRKQLQTEATAYNNKLWVQRGSAVMIGGTTMHYNNGGYPNVQNAEVLTITYYDDYDFDRAGINDPGTVYGVGTSDRTKSLSTGSKVKVLGTSFWTTTVTYYDNKARVIYNESKNEYLDTHNIVKSKLDFIGKVEKTHTYHKKGSQEAIVTEDVFEYDHMGRLTSQTQKINNQEAEQIVANSYDELGQLVQKNVGGIASSPVGGGAAGGGGTSTTLSTGLQTINYHYNIRGWLKGINDVDNLGDDVFAFGINYNTITEGLHAHALYNGNISETLWKTANDNQKRAYGYRYDELNRFTAANDHENRYVVSSITYDKVGNILSLARNGWQNNTNYGNMDVLSYQYDAGNKLKKVTDTGNKTYGFKDGTNTNDDFEYDANGNMIIDRNKGIASITYNHLNLPETVSISNSEGTGTISYIYDATGAKQQKIVTEGSSNTSTEYAQGYVYKNDNLEFFNQPEGIVEKEDDGYKYVYQFKDHLGNIRLSYSDRDNDGVVDILRNNTDIDGDGD
ncbi:hypothetical protein J8281_11535, partial [Aquimarina sp. U1-2]|uniref:DUF6443 domain-containing protein n=1 Tax=Aquimarina sp. U1-2 TaxID=2823141 RepID=UPI001FED4B2B